MPGVTAAQVKCPIISSVLADDAKRLEGIAIAINAKGLLSVTKSGVPGVIRDAESCEIDAPKDDFDLDCDWSFAKEQRAEAERTFDRLRRRLEDCLPSPLEQDPVATYSDERLVELGEKHGPSFVSYIKNTERVRDYSLDIELEDGSEASITFDLSMAKDTGLLRMNLNIYRY